MYLLNDDTIQVGRLRELYLFLIIKDKRVIALFAEEIIHLPVSTCQLRSLCTIDYRQWELNTIHLQLLISNKVKEEVIKQLVCCLWHRSSSNHLRGRVNAIYSVSVFCCRRISSCTVIAINFLACATCSNSHHSHTNTHNK